MKHTLNYIFIAAIALFCFTNAQAQNKPAKKPVKKAATKHKAAKAPVKKATVTTAKKAISLAGALPDSAKTKGGSTPASTNPGASLSEEIVVTTAYKPVLAEAVKIRRNPDLESVDPFKAPVTYSPIDKSLEQNTKINQFDAIKLPRESPAELQNNYAKLGVGNNKTTYGELYVNNGRDEALQVGGFLKHIAQNGSLYKQNYSKQEAGIFGKSIGDVSSLSGRVNYSLRNNYFYGYDNAAPPATLDVAKQRFSTLDGEAEISKNYKDEEDQFIYALKIGGYLFNNAFHANENNLVLSGYINQTVGQFYSGLSASVDFNTSKDSLYSLTNSLIKLNPYLKFQGTNYKIDAGINIVNEFGFASRISVFPAARLEFQVVPKYVRLIAEVRGDVNKASLRDFSETNPFLGQDITIKNSVDQLDISAGLKGMFAPGFGFKAMIIRNSVKDMPLFVNNFDFTKGYNRFNVVYDGGKALVTGFNGELDYKSGDDVDIFGRIEIRNYQLATEAQAWNLPKLKISAGTKINLSSQISINGTLMYRGETSDNLGSGKVATLPAFADVSGGIEYKTTKRVTLFLQVNNLLSNNYQTWLYYPNYGFNIFGGVGYKF